MAEFTHALVCGTPRGGARSRACFVRDTAHVRCAMRCRHHGRIFSVCCRFYGVEVTDSVHQSMTELTSD